jgi:hypothetical protein
MNVAEILIDRGRSEAEALLWKRCPCGKRRSSAITWVGVSLLGRASLRLGRFGEALSRLDEARSNFRHVGAEEEVPAVDARIAECQVAMGNAGAAVALVGSMLDRARASSGVAKVVSLLERVKAHALLQQNDRHGARNALDASLASARERHDVFETTLTLLSLIELDRLEGIEPPLEIVTESRTLLARLKVRTVPPVPIPRQPQPA